MSSVFLCVDDLYTYLDFLHSNHHASDCGSTGGTADRGSDNTRVHSQRTKTSLDHFPSLTKSFTCPPCDETTATDAICVNQPQMHQIKPPEDIYGMFISRSNATTTKIKPLSTQDLKSKKKMHRNHKQTTGLFKWAGRKPLVLSSNKFTTKLDIRQDKASDY